MNNLERRLHFRIIILSLIIFVIGVLITIDGVKKYIRYNSVPVNIESIQEDMQSGIRIKITKYRVAGSFENSGYIYYIMECPCEFFLLIEVNKDSYYSQVLNSQNHNNIVEQDYVIEGIVEKFDIKQEDSIRMDLLNNGISEYETDTKGIFKIKILENENTSIYFGIGIIVIALACLVLNGWIIKIKR